ncbi:MAG: carbon starvation protein A [Bacteroidetes bacterium]|nr:carbon starvation protein A [Bacteroidota bacterium]
MNVTIITVTALVCLFLGYRFYARYLSRKVYVTEGPDAKPEVMPSVSMEDGVDFVPTRRGVLFGHHFASIAGAAPILGPAIAIIWGWLPALIWVVVGVIFMGAVHDYGALVISTRHKGKSIGAIAEDMIGPRSKVLFLIVIFLLVFVVLAVFAYAIAKLFILYPGTVIPINFEIFISIIIGRYIYKRKGSLLIPSLLALVALYVMIYVGFRYPIYLPESLWINGSEVLTWIVFLMTYSFIASILPVWLLLQPRDYINSHKLIVGLVLIYAGLFVTQPEMDAPMVNFSGTNMLPWFPFLFITIACGAISGFHSLVSSGTTCKQIKTIKDTKFIGYGAMLGEATLAIAATMAVAAGFSSSEAWHAHYGDFNMAKGMQPSLEAFVNGTAGFLSSLGITQVFIDGRGNSHTLAAVFISVIVISFSATSLDTATRIQRYIIGELGETFKIKPLANNRYLQGFIAVLLPFLLIISDSAGKGGLRLWPLFGSTNQMVGALTLLVISIWLYKQKKNFWITVIPMIFITVITFIGTIQNIFAYFGDQSINEVNRFLLISISFVIGICQIWIIGEAITVFRKAGKTK